MGFLRDLEDSFKKVQRKIGSLADKTFSENLARQWRSFDPIARAMGEEYQRHMWNFSMHGADPLATNTTDYYGARERGKDSDTAFRHTYQNTIKSAAIVGTVFTMGAAMGGSSAGGGASSGTAAGTVAGNTGAPAAGTGGGSSVTGMTAAEIETLGATQSAGSVSSSLQGVNLATGQAATGGLSAGAGAGSGAGSLGWGEIAKQAIGPAIMVGGQMLASANTPSEGESEEERLRARQRATDLGGISTTGGRRPTILPYSSNNRVRVMSAPEMLNAAPGFYNQLDPKSPAKGLLSQTRIAELAGYAMPK